MVRARLAFRWIVRTVAAGSLLASGAVLAQPPSALGPGSFESEWTWSTFGTGIGVAGLEIVELEPGGPKSLLVAAEVGSESNTRFWYLVEGRNSGYSMQWSSLPSARSIVAVRALSLEGKSWIATLDEELVELFRAETFEMARSFVHGARNPMAMVVGDLDADGSAELVICDPNSLLIFDPRSGELLHSRPEFGCIDLDLANTDADPALEIALVRSNGTAYLIDGESLNVEWSLAEGAGSHIRIAELAAELGREVAVLLGSGEGIGIFSPAASSMLYSISMLTPDTLESADVDGDGFDELMVGWRSFREWRLLRGGDGAVIWSIDPFSPVGGATAGDLDGDGDVEVVLGGRQDSVDRLMVVDGLSGAIEWQSEDLGGPFLGLDAALPCWSCRPLLAATSFRSEGPFGPGRYLVFDLLERALLATGPPNPRQGESFLDARFVSLGRSMPGLCTVSDAYQSSWVACFDWLSGAEIWSEEAAGSLFFTRLEVADLDGQGQEELVLAIGGGDRGSEVRLSARSAESGFMLWESPWMSVVGLEFSLLKASNLLGENHPEIVGGVIGRNFAIVDGRSGAVLLPPTPASLTTLGTGDRDGDGDEELYVGVHQRGQIQQRSPQSGEVLTVLGIVGSPHAGLTVADLTRDSIPDILLLSEGRITVLDGVTLSLLYQGESLGDQAAYRDSLMVGDFDLDGEPEVLLNTGVGFALLSVWPKLLADDFETGDASRWSWNSPI